MRLNKMAIACSKIAIAMHEPSDVIDAEWLDADGDWELPPGYEDIGEEVVVGDD